MRTINMRFLAALVCGVVVIGGVIVGVHALQSRRIAAGLLRQAERGEEQGRPEIAARFLSRYLELEPDDNDARARLGRILADRSVGGSIRSRERALFVLEETLLREPDRVEERLLLVPIALDLRRHELAGEHLDVLERQVPADGRIDSLRAQWHLAQSRRTEAAASFRNAIAHAPERIDNYLALADLLRRQTPRDLKNDRQADRVMDALVAANANNAAAYLARWEYRRKWNPPQTAETIAQAGEDVLRAQKLDPDGVDSLLATIDLADVKGNAEEATRLVREGLHRFPAEVRLYRAFAGLELRAGRGAEAATCLREGAQRVSGVARQDLLWLEANVRADLGKSQEVGPVLEQMRKAGCSRPALDYIEARLLLLGERWSEAAQALERLRPLVEEKADLVENIDLFLARCYAQLGEPVRQLAACERALTINPSSAAARQGVIEASLSLGRVDQALEEAKRSASAAKENSGDWVQIARLSLLRSLNDGRKDWGDVEAALARAEKTSPDAVDVVLLRVELLLAQGKSSDARTCLQQAKEKKPEEIRFLTALAELADRAGDRAETQRLLGEAEALGRERVTVCAARARICGRRSDAAARDELRKLCQDLAPYSEADLNQLLPTLAEQSQRLGNIDDARRLWTRLAAQPRYGNDLRLQLQLFQMAAHAGDDAEMTRLLSKLEAIEHGKGACWNFCEAQRLIEAARKGNAAALEEARAHLDTVAGLRPSWSAVPLARAEIERQRENWDAAVANYHRAIDLGGRTVSVTRELVQTLLRCRRFAEAEREIRQLQASDLAAAGLGRVAAELSLRNQEPALAVKAALEVVSTNSSDYRDHLWLGQMLAAADPLDPRAEKHLRRARELSATAPETWVALVQCLAAAGRKPEAEAVVADAARKLPSASRAGTLAPCYESLGRLDEAEKSYRQAADAEKSAVALRELGHFYFRNDRAAEAEAPLRKLVQGEVKVAADDAIAARHELAWLLAGDSQRFPEALALVGLMADDAGRITEKQRPSEAQWASEQRARIRVLARSPRLAVREQAITRLDELRKRQALSNEDRWLLVQLHESSGGITRALELGRDLLSAEPRNPRYLAYQARLLLLVGQVDEAERAVEKLEAIEKARRLEANALAAVELRAQVLERRGKTDEALQRILPLTKLPKINPEHLSLAIGCQARQKRFVEALDLCGQAWEKLPPDTAARMSVAVLRTGVKDQDQINRVERWLHAALQKSDKPSADLLLCLADLRDVQGKYAEAEAAYRRVLAVNPDQATALNNLAWLLTARGAEGDEALQLINRAIATAGPNPAFLDTRAFVQLARENPQGAREDLERAAQALPSPEHYLHLARTHTQSKDLSAAAAALQRARAAGLDPDKLHPLERPSYHKLIETLPQR